MSRKLYIKAKSTRGGSTEVNAVEIYLYHSKERKSVNVVVQEASLRKENGYSVCTTEMFGGIRAKLMDMPRYSKAKFDAIPMNERLIQAMVDRLILESKGTLEIEVDENGNWVTI